MWKNIAAAALTALVILAVWGIARQINTWHAVEAFTSGLAGD